ncbi:hypothetical protein [Frankia sp. EAN1pec]|uniref:hypothetical protein n=1 Tax=Parafrankia sp. (strain EAN1pec) TaxID=298653 RepID=UPI0018DCA351
MLREEIRERLARVPDEATLRRLLARMIGTRSPPRSSATLRSPRRARVTRGGGGRRKDQLARLPWVDIPASVVTHDHGHGRDETRTLKAATVGFLDFP